MNNPIVDIIMVVYNQEDYISKAIESVLMQKTNFPFRLIIGEDCSTDSSREICVKYHNKFPAQIKLILHNKNIGLLKNYKSVFAAISAKYIAILEGDDYWIDKYKLQKQVDFLEKNLNVGLVHTDCDLIFESGKVQNKSQHKNNKLIKNGHVFNDLLKHNYIRPLTVMVRKELYINYVDVDKYIGLGFKTFDYPFWLDIAKHCEFYYLDYSSAHYRIHNNSISNSNRYKKNVDFHLTSYAIRKYAIKKYCYNDNILERAKNTYLKDRLVLEMSCKNYDIISNLAKSLAVKDFKSFVLKIMSSNKLFIIIFSQFYVFRQKRLDIPVILCQ